MVVSPIKLRNRYTSEIVFTDSIDEIRKENSYDFIRVYNLENPDRKYLVNIEAFEVLDK